MEKVISIDLWNTLIRVTKKNRKYLSKLLSDTSKLTSKEVNSHIKSSGKYFDNLAIKSGKELSSINKLKRLLKVTRSTLTAQEVHSKIASDLYRNPPELIEPKALKLLDKFLHTKNIGIVIASNSGFVSSEIMRSVIEKLKIIDLKSYKSAFFSEEIGFAKPSKDFFENIKSHGYEIILHIGDHPIADTKIKDPTIQGLLYSPTNLATDQKNIIRSIEEIVTYLKAI